MTIYVFSMDVLCLCIWLYLYFSPQTMIVPMAENLLGWTDRESSIFYSVAGVEVGQSACM